MSRRVHMRWISISWLLCGVVLLSGCSSVTDAQTSSLKPVSVTQYTTYGAVSRVEYLHLLNIENATTLRTSLGKLLSYDVLALDSLLRHPLPDDERKRVYDTLRLIAVQNEKFPVPSLSDDPKVSAVLQAALANDPVHSNNLRRRNWTKPMWQQ